MSKVIEIHDSPYNCLPTYKRVVSSGGAATIAIGTPIKKGGTSAANVVPCVDGVLTIGTDQPFMGIAASTSTDTAAADGVVEIYRPLPGVIYKIKAKTASLANTAAEIAAMVGDAYALDLTSGDWTLDTVAGDAATNAFIVEGGDPTTSTLFVSVRSDATEFGRQQV